MKYNRKHRKIHKSPTFGDFYETGEYRCPQRGDFALYEDSRIPYVISISFDCTFLKLKILAKIKE